MATKLPANLPSSAGAWHLRTDVSEQEKEAAGLAGESVPQQGAIYQHGQGGILGLATGRLTATMGQAEKKAVEKALRALKLKLSVFHQPDDPKDEASVMIEHDATPLGALPLMEEIRKIDGLKHVAAEILSARRARGK